MDEIMMDDDVLSDSTLNDGTCSDDEEAHVWIYHTDDEDHEENQADTFEEKESDDEDPFEGVRVESVNSGLDGLVFDEQSVEDEIAFLQGASGSFVIVLLLTYSTQN